MPGNNSDETDPFARLKSTHRRIEDRLRDLGAAVGDLGDPGHRAEAIEVIRETAGFFERGAVRHVEDEEKTLFPRLVGFEELGAVLSALAEEHERHRALERQLGQEFETWPEGGPGPKDQAAVAELARALTALYQEHIRREEEELFPAAQRLLTLEIVAEMGREMMERRPDRGKGGKDKERPPR